MARVKSQVKGLKNFATQVETFLREHCSSEEYGASALEATLGQDEEEADSGGRNLLGTELMEEIGGRLAVTDVGSSGSRLVKFWIDEVPTILFFLRETVSERH